uniref:Uncharacterized protein n=1 Tax=Candidatus Kentrum sp. LPFa TaxID=2126335 RepID=A0A450W0Q5_9GAMM|nr:MAG: hypothetical protein BECKLPF1236A_GA0070988_1004015 [Candidatus Kentron sp. LPFa]VFK27161.1 MAG: hypothetical protein BECKLPF1236C_GA0070990_1004315 [Candidatus Kentron sp. LPFa]
MKFARFSFLSVVILILSSAVPAFAYDSIVTKKTFTMASYTTVGGQTIPNVKVGWESYGTLNAAKDNVILITQYFAGNSHAAGKYVSTDTSCWLLGRNHRFRQGHRHGQVLRNLVRYAGELSDLFQECHHHRPRL